MKFPDKDTWTIIYCLVLLGCVASYCLLQFQSVPFQQSIWMTVPAFLVLGYLGLRRIYCSVEVTATRYNTPMKVIFDPDIGEITQYPERWETTFGDFDFTIDAGDDGPTSKQLNIVKCFPEKFNVLYPQIIDGLRSDFADELDSINTNTQAVHVFSAGQNPDLEIGFNSTEEDSDMGYFVSVTEWQVTDVYGAD